MIQQSQPQESNASPGNAPSVDPDLEFEVFKLEYDHLAEGYRHTYQTIWQAGAVFMAVSAALLAFSGARFADGMYNLIEFVWPLPFLFWWLGIFTPMDRYGKLRFQRLQELESITQKKAKQWGHRIRHFTYMHAKLRRRQKLLVLSTFRVGYVVDVFAITVILTWIGWVLVSVLDC